MPGYVFSAADWDARHSLEGWSSGQGLYVHEDGSAAVEASRSGDRVSIDVDWSGAPHEWFPNPSGMTPQFPALVAEPVPESISAFQGKAVLSMLPSPTGQEGRSVLDDIEEATIQAGGLARLAFTESKDWDRNSETVKVFASAFDWSDEYLDELFTKAKKVKA